MYTNSFYFETIFPRIKKTYVLTKLLKKEKTKKRIINLAILLLSRAISFYMFL